MTGAEAPASQTPVSRQRPRSCRRGATASPATASIDAAKRYYAEFKAQQADVPQDRRLKIGLIYSFGANEAVDDYLDDEGFDTGDLDQGSRDFLDAAIADYNAMFGTMYDTSSDKFQNYYKDLSERLKKREIDLVIVDLYPFEETVKSMASEQAIIEKIDIGGPAMVRAAAKNHANVAVLTSSSQYSQLLAALGDGGFTLEQRQRLPRQAFAFGARNEFGGHAGSVAISARAIAAEDELVLVAFEKSAHEIRVAVERVVAGIRRHVAVQVRKVSEPLVGEAAGLDAPPGVGDVFGHIGADVRPEGVGVAQDGGSRVGLQDLGQTSEARVEHAFAVEVGHFLKVNGDGNPRVGG